MFLGTYNHSIDKKNRLNLPTKIVVKLSDVVIVNKGFDGCLELRSQQEFENYSNQLMKLSQNKSESRILVRQLLANAAEITIDKQNRILIPGNLLNECNIKEQVTIIGIGNKLEIWPSQLYEEYKKNTDNTYVEIAERIDDVNK